MFIYREMLNFVYFTKSKFYNKEQICLSNINETYFVTAILKDKY